MKRSKQNTVAAYLDLGRKFLELSAWRAALGCSAAAVTLESACTEAWTIARRAADAVERHLPDAESTPSDAMRDLLEAKGDLDVESRALHLMLDVGWLWPQPTGPANRVLARVNEQHLREQVLVLLRRLRQTGRIVPPKLSTILDELAQRMDITEAEVAARSSEASIDDFDDFSIEHQAHNLANDYYKAERFEDAIALYTGVIAVNANLIETYFNRCLAYTRTNEYDRAIDDINRVIDMNPLLAEAYYTRGLIREYQLRYKDAIADYDEALRVDKKYDRARSQKDIAKGKLASQQTPAGDGSPSCDKDGRITDFSFCLLKPQGSLADVGACTEAVRELRKLVHYLKGHEALSSWGAVAPRGILLAGPPGVGKTHMVRALAAEADCPCYAPPPTIFLDMWAGNTERNVRALWQQASAHRRSMIFIDEIDGLMSARSDVRSDNGETWFNKVIVTLLELMGGVRSGKSRLVTIGATNRLDNIDKAFRREGRFDRIIHVSSPSARGLADIWLIQLGMARAQASRRDFVEPPLADLIDRRNANLLDELFAGTRGNGHPLRRLARDSHSKGLNGASVREIIRRVAEDRAVSEIELGIKQGPISLRDLQLAVENFVPNIGIDDDRDGQDRRSRYVN